MHVQAFHHYCSGYLYEIVVSRWQHFKPLSYIFKNIHNEVFLNVASEDLGGAW